MSTSYSSADLWGSAATPTSNPTSNPAPVQNAVPAPPAQPLSQPPQTLAPAGDSETEAILHNAEEVNPWTNAVCVALTLSKFGNAKKADSENISTDADKSMLRVTKQLLESEEFTKICKLDREIAKHIRRVSQRSYFKNGFYLVSKRYVKKLRDDFISFKSERAKLVAAFSAEYAACRDKAKQLLKSQFNPTDYPMAEEIAGLFGMQWHFISFGTPTDLNEIDPEMFESERRKLQQEMRNAGLELVQTMRTEAANYLSHLVEKLGTEESGKKKVFKNTTVTNLTEFLDFFDIRNDITNDGQLAALVKKVKATLSGNAPDGTYIEAESLRTNDALRDSVRAQLSTIKGEVDSLITNKGSRKIVFAAQNNASE